MNEQVDGVFIWWYTAVLLVFYVAARLSVDAPRWWRASMRRSLLWISDFLKVRVLRYSDGKTVYLERYFLFSRRGITCYLHHIVSSDEDSDLHNHPWPWAYSLILSGWYCERRAEMTEPYGEDPALISYAATEGLFSKMDQELVHSAGGINKIANSTYHRIVLPHGSDVWTLFIHGPWYYLWGFRRHHPMGQFYFQPFDHPTEGTIVNDTAPSQREDHAWWSKPGVIRGRDHRANR